MVVASLVALSLSLLGGAQPPVVTAAAAEPLPRLKTEGRRLVTDPGGREVVLRGANIMASEWERDMDWERRALPMLAGAWKGNVVVRGFAADPVNARDPTYLAWLDEYVGLAEANRVYVVFVFRSYAIDGGQPRMPGRRAQRALAFLAGRYRDKTNVIYGLQVEPHDIGWRTLRPRFEAMVDAIHAAAAPYRPIVLVPGIRWGRDLSPAITDPVRRRNVVYKTHPYAPARKFERYFGRAHAAGLPVFVSEFGHAPDLGMAMSDVNSLLRYARKARIGWAAWNFDAKGPPALLASRDGTPTIPYGLAVKVAMMTPGRVLSAEADAGSRPRPECSTGATALRLAPWGLRRRSGRRRSPATSCRPLASVRSDA